jgi:uncharacterized protein DUF4258
MRSKANLAYTRHARRRMAQRRISEAEVEAVLASYHTSRHDRKGNEVLIGRIGGRRIKVVLDRRVTPSEIITVAD